MKMTKELRVLKCFEEIDNTLCLNNNKGKLEFGIDTEEHSDCDSAIGMVEDLENIKQTLLKAQENARSEEILQKYYQEGITLDSVRELKKENELLKEIIKSLFDEGCPLHQYIDKDFGLTIEVDSECSIMHLGKFKGVDLDEKLKEVLE